MFWGRITLLESRAVCVRACACVWVMSMQASFKGAHNFIICPINGTRKQIFSRLAEPSARRFGEPEMQARVTVTKGYAS